MSNRKQYFHFKLRLPSPGIRHKHKYYSAHESGRASYTTLHIRIFIRNSYPHVVHRVRSRNHGQSGGAGDGGTRGDLAPGEGLPRDRSYNK